jgi:hypothetical protein
MQNSNKFTIDLVISPNSLLLINTGYVEVSDYIMGQGMEIQPKIQIMSREDMVSGSPVAPHAAARSVLVDRSCVNYNQQIQSRSESQATNIFIQGQPLAYMQTTRNSDSHPICGGTNARSRNRKERFSLFLHGASPIHFTKPGQQAPGRRARRKSQRWRGRREQSRIGWRRWWSRPSRRHPG